MTKSCVQKRKTGVEKIIFVLLSEKHGFFLIAATETESRYSLLYIQPRCQDKGRQNDVFLFDFVWAYVVVCLSITLLHLLWGLFGVETLWSKESSWRWAREPPSSSSESGGALWAPPMKSMAKARPKLIKLRFQPGRSNFLTAIMIKKDSFERLMTFLIFYWNFGVFKHQTPPSYGLARVLCCYGWLFPPFSQRAPSAFHF